MRRRCRARNVIGAFADVDGAILSLDCAHDADVIRLDIRFFLQFADGGFMDRFVLFDLAAGQIVSSGLPRRPSFRTRRMWTESGLAQVGRNK